MKTGLERAEEIELNSFAYFLKTKEYLTVGSIIITAIGTGELLGKLGVTWHWT